MEKNLPFPREEYRRRVAKTKELMDRNGIEMLLVVDPANMNYLTGYDGWSFYVHQGVIVSQEESLPALKDYRALRVSSHDRSGGNADALQVKPGETAVLADLEGPGID